MRRILWIIGVLAFGGLFQLLLLLVLALSFFQSRPAQDFAGSILRYAHPLAAAARSMEKAVDSLWYQSGKIPDEIPFYEIEIPKDELRKLDALLAKEGNVLSDDAREWLKADFIFNDRKHDIKIRVRGDQPNHWRYPKKSWRLKFKKEDLFMGMKEVNLIIPEDRAWFAALLNNKRAKDMHLLQPPMQFVVVSINGSSPMLYLEVEHWTKEMFERQSRTSNVDLYKQNFINPFSHIGHWDTYLHAYSNENHSLETADLLLRLAHINSTNQNATIELLLNTLFFSEQLSAWYAHSLLAGDGHVVDDNVRLFYDYSLGKFEPIPWDVHLFNPKSILEPPENDLWQTIFSIPARKLQAHRFLWSYLSDAKKVEEDKEFAERKIDLIKSVIFKDRVQFLTRREINNDIERRKQQMLASIELLTSELQASNVVVRRMQSSLEQYENQNVWIVDFFVKGPAMAMLSGSLALPSQSRLYLDNGDMELTESDTLVQLDERGQIADMNQALLDPVSTKGNQYRFYVVSVDQIENYQFPYTNLTNAVTGEILVQKGAAFGVGDVLYSTPY